MLSPIHTALKKHMAVLESTRAYLYSVLLLVLVLQVILGLLVQLV